MSCCSHKSKCCETSLRLKQHLYMVVPMKNPLVEEKSGCCENKKCCEKSKIESESGEHSDNKVHNSESEKITIDLEADGLTEESIESVVQQSGSNRNQAILALKNNNNDVVDAIVSLL